MPVKTACWCKGLELLRFLSLFSEEGSPVEGEPRGAAVFRGAFSCSPEDQEEILLKETADFSNNETLTKLT